jgi:hypothetical protein
MSADEQFTAYGTGAWAFLTNPTADDGWTCGTASAYRVQLARSRRGASYPRDLGQRNVGTGRASCSCLCAQVSITGWLQISPGTAITATSTYSRLRCAGLNNGSEGTLASASTEDHRLRRSSSL